MRFSIVVLLNVKEPPILWGRSHSFMEFIV